MATFFIGDVHGCSDELSRLLDELAPGPHDQVYLTGDLFDRGPDPLGVLDLVQDRGLPSVMSNHEDYILHAMRAIRESGSFETTHEYVTRCLRQVAPEQERFYRFLEELPLYRRGPGWVVVHAGIDPSRGVEDSPREVLLNVRTWPPGDPEARPWYESYQGSELVVFGHNARRLPVMYRRSGRLRAVGLDTGCVYGGRLTALHLEEERLISVAAAQDYRRG